MGEALTLEFGGDSLEFRVDVGLESVADVGGKMEFPVTAPLNL